MNRVQIFCFVSYVLANCVLASANSALVNPCKMKDLECLRQSTKDVLSITSGGIKEYGIHAIDPLSIPALEFKPSESVDLVYLMSNVVLTGMKNQNVTYFNMDMNKTQNVRLQTFVENLESKGDVCIALASNHAQAICGNFTAHGAALITTDYPSEIQKYPDGSAHFVLGSEVIQCESIGKPSLKLKLEEGLVESIRNERQRLLQMHEETDLLKTAMCEAVKLANSKVIANTRTLANLLPKESFFIDV